MWLWSEHFRRTCTRPSSIPWPSPFGGVKDSGYGRKGGVEGLQCYTVVKNVSHLTA
jgi:acyl-CoA reductase-like NAD-dependent aldehyde dehydrogenase